MRDDIHRGAPVRQHWQRLMQACTRDVDWLANGKTKLTEALATEIRGCTTPDFLRHLRLQAGNLALFHPEHPASTMMDLAFEVARHWPADQPRPSERAVLGAALAERVEAVLRQCDRHMINKPQQRMQLMERLRTLATDQAISEAVQSAFSTDSATTGERTGHLDPGFTLDSPLPGTETEPG